MHSGDSAFRLPPTRRISFALGLALGALGPGLFLGFGSAQAPPQPDFFWPYGVVQAGGANLDPAVQPVIAFVRGTSCGSAATKLATAGPDVPAGDVGKTVYVVDVLADGAGAGQRPGCGRTGDPVSFWFPQVRRMAAQQPAFKQGQARADLDASRVFGERLTLPQVSTDGPLQ